MYCPNCGSQNKKKQNYCRYCGLNLQEIERSFLNQLVFGEDSKRLRNLRGFRKFIDYAQTSMMMLLVIGMVAIFFSGWDAGKNFIRIGLVFFFLAQFNREVIGYFQRRNVKKKNKQDFSNSTIQKEFETRETNKLIEEKPFTPIPSATENSTELLFVDGKTKKLE